MNLSSHPIGLAANFWSNNSSQQHPLGTKGQTADGRVYRYCQAGAADLVAGNVIQGPATIPEHLAMAVAAPTAALGGRLGDTYVSVTPAAVGGAANLYAEGYLGVDTSPPLGFAATVNSHLAITASVAFIAQLEKEDPIHTLMTTATKIGLMQNPYKGVIQSPVTTATGLIVGVAPYIITATYYGWIQTSGPAEVLITGTPALQAPVVGTSGTPGAVAVLTTTNLVINPIIGHMMQIGVSGKCNWVMLSIRD
jgi:hypothetical protein